MVHLVARCVTGLQQVCNLGGYLVDGVCGRAPRSLVGKRRTEIHNLLLRDVMPDRQQNLLP